MGATQAHAQADYPNRQIQIFSGLAAGGDADIIMRYFAAKNRTPHGVPIELRQEDFR